MNRVPSILASLGKNPNGVNLKVDPWFDNLRSDPRFGVIIQRMGLVP